MEGPIGFCPGLRRPVVKCNPCGWYLETSAQIVLNLGDKNTLPCRYCGEDRPIELEQDELSVDDMEGVPSDPV